MDIKHERNKVSHGKGSVVKNIFLILILFPLSITPGYADEYRAAYLEFKQTSDTAFDMLWKVPTRGQGQGTKLSVVLPADLIRTSPTRRTTMGAIVIERSSVSRQGALAGAQISIQGLDREPTDVLVRIQRLDGTTETARLTAASTSFVVKGSPEFLDVVNTYVVFGVEHIWQGIDHLMFVACLIFIAGSWRRILITITGFTVAHSITLTLAALELVRVPVPPIEATIALSIVFLAREIAIERRDTLTWRYPIAISSTFGLLHGFGFASALSDIGLPQTEIPAALLAFNVGVEIGQVVFVAAIVLLAKSASQLLKAVNISSSNWLRAVEKPIAYGVGGITMLWTIERVVLFA
jgi:hydrogenase/urease accessory protein HupE